ncbi:MAG: hypothetical protein HFJ55_04585 [Clostridia bacterium]|nr:hypothetical protein [Clostridia bacterium]
MLEKIIKKDKNEELERVLEEKNIEEQVKNLLQGILYKIEVSYKDYKKVKVTEITEKQYIDELLRNIERNCNQIKTIKLNEQLEDDGIQEELEKNKFYIKENNIISYPIEKELLYAIEKHSNNKRIVNNRYEIITNALSNLINAGKSIDRIEPFRDFNGWSWTTLNNEIPNVIANLVYQSIRILINEEFLENWVKDVDGIIDYIPIMQEELISRYGETLAKEIQKRLEQIAVINERKENSNFAKEMNDKLKKIEEQIEKLNNTKDYVMEITENKKKATKEIKEIETILSQNSRIEEEYERRIREHHKIFNINVLIQQLDDRKHILLNTIEEYNYYLNPTNYLSKKNQLIEQKEILEVLKYDENQIEEVLIQFEKTFLECFNLKLKNQTEAENILKLIYKFRYFMLLPFNREKEIKDVEELKLPITKAEKELLKLAVEKKVIEGVPFEIMEHVFKTRIVILEELYYKITEEAGKYYVQIFDENITEEKFEIMPKDKMKLDKKIKIFI